MDLKKLDTVAAANEGFELELFNPGTLEGLGIFITVLGRDSEQFRSLMSEQNRRRMAKAAKGSTFRMSAANLKEVERDSIELLAACTVSWRDKSEGTEKPTLTLGEEELACDKSNAMRVYDAYPWIKEQVDAGVADRVNFIRR